MLDTIRVKASLPVLSDREQELQRNESTAWVNRSERLFHSHTKDLQETIKSYHRESGFYASVCDGTIRKAQGSMARLVHGSNGIQIKSPEELSRGRCAYLSHLAFLNNRVREDDLKLTRVDLAINLHLDPRKVLGIHRIAKHPMVYKETEEYYNTPPAKRWGKGPHMLSKLSTLRFHGTKTTISVYDKVREVLGRKQGEWPENSHCTRVEIQLRTAKHVAKHLGFEGRDFITLDQLDFEMCYQAFRRILMRFEEQGGVPTFQPSLASDLAILERHPETWDTIGMRPLDWYYSTGVSERRFREVLNQVRKTHLELHDFRWGEVLPKDRLPDIIDIGENGQEYLVRSPWFFG